MDFWFLLVGKIVCIGSGLLLSGIFLGLCLGYFWKKLKEAQGFDRIYRIVLEDAKRRGERT